MSLLREIQDLSTTEDSDLETLLRKCRVLASRLKNDEFKDWVHCELDGYPNGAKLPDYRQFRTFSLGDFGGYFGSGLKNAPIAESLIPEEIRPFLTTVKVGQNVGSIKGMIQTHGEEGALRIPWPADVFRMFGQQIYENMNLLQAWQVLNVSSLVGLLSTVQNRILSFALEIEAANPQAGEAGSSSTPLSNERVNQIFTYNISGNVGNLASGHDIHQVATINVSQGDLQSLSAYLESKGVKPGEIQELEAALKADGNPAGKGLGKSASKWLGKMVGKAAEGTWDIAAGTAAGLLTEALKAYYGLS